MQLTREVTRLTTMTKYSKPIIRVSPPGPNARYWIEQDHQFLSTSLSRTSDLVAASAQGAFVVDVDENVFLDFGSGLSVTIMGHNHPKVVEAIHRQADMLIHANSCDYLTLPQIEYARRLTALSPGKFPKRVFFSNSGTESIECGIKAAKFKTRKPGMVAFVGGFHGRTMGSLALTSSSAVSRRGYISSLMPNVAFSPYAYCYRCPFSQVEESCGMECLSYLENWVLGKVMPIEECAAILVEPLQGAGGYIVPPKKFLQGIQEICRKYDILLMVDEVQTGFCKTGNYFASQTFEITPDILCLSKAIAAGLPMGVTVTRAELLEWELNTHENTLGGNPIVVAAALAVLDVLENEKLAEAAVRIGELLTHGFRRFQERHPVIGDVRNAGSMIGVEFVTDPETKKPASAFRDRFIKGCFQRGLLTLGAGPSSVRLSPPLILSEEEVQIGLEIIEEVLKTESG